ncbi:PREDICTED: arrestin domain-containing protein 3 [Ceratosolen solmsi marchali]|uniref:Arrestin domain-containing protein 3 n=1 Tax=Ceratosolen solmsi marchali TaxID=326594 RepID=A0AAJ6YTL2_9HYME|nr:PREDICTED: arrestin domain-containing protein 3 [Ceratosolen solmsi marchali]
MGLTEFKIHFDNPYATYCPDQTVTGNVILTIDSTKKIKAIQLRVKGEADTYWSTDRQELNNDGRYRTETDVVTAHEEYFKAQFYILGSSSGEQIELPSGTHSFPFNYVLPPNLPSSFESDFGRIRYTMKAILDRPWKFDHETKVAFTVISHLDLNQQPNASEPVLLEKNKTFCCLCCGTPPLSVNISLPVRGYVPGQMIPIKVNVENQSGVTVETLKLVLEKIVTYTATTPHSEKKVVENTVAEVSKGPVGGNETTSYEQTVKVPSIPPSNLNNCGIIDLEYKLKIEAVVTGLYYRNLRDSTPIYIGTIPLSTYQIPQPSEKAKDIYPLPTAPEESHNYSSPTSNLYPNLAPPSYEESIYRARSLRDREESDYVIGTGHNFAPRYPVYNFKPSQL